jgi:hypothetical protein
MPFVPKVDNFLWPAAGSFTRAGYKGEPKALIVMGNGFDISPSASARPFFGACAGSAAGDEAYAALASEDNVGNANVRISSGTGLSAALRSLTDATNQNTINITSLNADGITGTSVRGAAPASENFPSIGILSLAGISNAKVFTATAPGDTNPFSVAGFGSWTPNFVILFAAATTGAPTANRSFGVGWATSPNSQQCACIMDRDGAATTVTRRAQSTSSLLQLISTTLQLDVDLVSFDEGGITFSDAAGSTHTFYGIALKVPNVFLTTFNTPGGTGPFDVLGCPFSPEAMLTLSWARAASASIQTHAVLCMSMACAPANANQTDNQFACEFYCENGLNFSNTDQDVGRRALSLVSPLSPVTRCIARLDAFLAAGARLNATILNAGGDEVLCCFLGGVQPTVRILGGQILGGQVGA